MQRIAILLLTLVCTFASCRNTSAPEPYGYVRIAVPDTCYAPFADNGAEWQHYPCSFDVSCHARLVPRARQDEPYWFDITYPSLNATMHCSYKPLHGNLPQMTNDAMEFVYKNASHASAIPERPFENPDAHVYGVVFDLYGNAASPCQFFLTDSVRHFFRGSVYCNCVPNADSLAPVHDYLRQDVYHLIETFRWTY